MLHLLAHTVVKSCFILLVYKFKFSTIAFASNDLLKICSNYCVSTAPFLFSFHYPCAIDNATLLKFGSLWNHSANECIDLVAIDCYTNRSTPKWKKLRPTKYRMKKKIILKSEFNETISMKFVKSIRIQLEILRTGAGR